MQGIGQAFGLIWINGIKVDGKAVSINPPLLFTRLAAIVQREGEDGESYFSFEMTHEPMSLFKDGFMRKPDKPTMRNVLMPDHDETISTQQLHPSAIYTIDGGALILRVRWIKSTTFEELALQYTKYTRKHYSSCYVIFDGYDKNTTKASEHMRLEKGIRGTYLLSTKIEQRMEDQRML